jgi:hypothetical protein
MLEQLLPRLLARSALKTASVVVTDGFDLSGVFSTLLLPASSDQSCPTILSADPQIVNPSLNPANGSTPAERLIQPSACKKEVVPGRAMDGLDLGQAEPEQGRDAFCNSCGSSELRPGCVPGLTGLLF